MKKPLFSDKKLPYTVTSLSDPTADKTICTICNAIYDGTDAFMIHLEKLEDKYVNPEDLARIFEYTCDKPIYTMNYRTKNNKTDEQLITEQIMAVEAGASMIDMMGDMFAPSPLELTHDSEAIRKQQDVIEKIHTLGGEVLLSSHTWVYMTTDELLAHTLELEKRGADFVKIAMTVNSEEEGIDVLKSTWIVKNQLHIPFLHICMGQYGKLHRAIGPMLGSCFALCVQQYTEAGHKEKPLLRAQKAVFDNICCKPHRSDCVNTEKEDDKERRFLNVNLYR